MHMLDLCMPAERQAHGIGGGGEEKSWREGRVCSCGEAQVAHTPLAGHARLCFVLRPGPPPLPHTCRDLHGMHAAWPCRFEDAVASTPMDTQVGSMFGRMCEGVCEGVCVAGGGRTALIVGYESQHLHGGACNAAMGPWASHVGQGAPAGQPVLYS